MGFIAVVDYGVGNLMSVTNALDFLGFENKITKDPKELDCAAGVIFPGVGAFAAAMGALESSGLVPHVKRQAARKPFLGICVGMQMLFERGLEMQETPGLSLLKGEVRRIETDYKLPHIGWNSLKILKPTPLLQGVDDGAFVYFVHSFCAAGSVGDLAATVSYGEDVTAIVQSGHVFGCQFHPEKSGETGLQILKNFGELL